jgi:hypothetical protein
LRTTLNAWPEGTPDIVDHGVIKDYIQNTSKKTGVSGVTRWGARVVDVQKEETTWKVTWSVLRGDAEKGNVEEELPEVSVSNEHLELAFSHDCSISMQLSLPLVTIMLPECQTYRACLA